MGLTERVAGLPGENMLPYDISALKKYVSRLLLLHSSQLRPLKGLTCGTVHMTSALFLDVGPLPPALEHSTKDTVWQCETHATSLALIHLYLGQTSPSP